MHYAVLSALLYGFKGIFAKLAYQADVTVPQLLLLRFVLATPLLWIIYRTRSASSAQGKPQLNRSLLLKILGIGSLFGVTTIADFMALSYLPVSVERMILFTFPGIIILIQAARQRRFPALEELLTFFFIYFGLYLVMGSTQAVRSDISPTGLALALFSSVTYAFFLVLSKPVVDQIGSLAFTTFSSTVTTILVIVYFANPVIETGLMLSSEGWTYLLLLAVFSTVLPSIFLMEGVKRIGSTRSGLISTCSVVVTLIAAIVLLGERMVLTQVIGAAVMVTAIVGMKLRAQRKLRNAT